MSVAAGESGEAVTRLAEIAERGVAIAMGAGAAAAEAYCEDSAGVRIRVFDGAVESLTDAAARGIGLRVLRADGATGHAYGTDLGESGLHQLAEAAVAAAAVADADEFAGLPERCGSTPVGGLVDQRFAASTTAAKIELAVTADRIARERDPRIGQVENTVYADSHDRVAIANSGGFRDAYETTACYAYCSAFAGTGDDLMTGLGVGMARAAADLDPVAIGAEAADRALALLGARPLSPRRCPVVLDPFVAASLISIVAGMLSADSAQRGRTPFAGRVGETIAGPALSLVDDGLLAVGPASAPFDGEGVATRRTPLIADRRLRTLMFDTRTARKDGHAVSTASARRGSYRSLPSVGASNLVVAPGERSLEGLFKLAGDGLYVTGVVGLHSGVNPVSGDFSVGASGVEIVAGELGRPVREIAIAGDLVALVAAVTAVGDDSRWAPFGGSVSTPSLLIGELAVAGR